MFILILGHEAFNPSGLQSPHSEKQMNNSRKVKSHSNAPFNPNNPFSQPLQQTNPFAAQNMPTNQSSNTNPFASSDWPS
eukprot:Pgem_evm1s9767